MSQNGNSGYIYSALNSIVQITRQGIRNWSSWSPNPTNPSKFGFSDEKPKNTDPFANIIVRDIEPEPEEREEKMKVYFSKEIVQIFHRLPVLPAVLFKPKGVASAFGVLSRYTARVGTKHFLSDDWDKKKKKTTDNIGDLSFPDAESFEV